MVKLATLSIVILVLTAAVIAENPQHLDLPVLTTAPVLDGDRFTVPDEWTGALQMECSPSQVRRDGATFGWRDQQSEQSEVSANQLLDSEDEDASERRTDADYSSQIWMAWDSYAFHFLVEARDNVRDTEGDGIETDWWERDSITLYLDMVNSRERWSGYVYERARINAINYVAVPQVSSSVTVTWERQILDERIPTQDPYEIEGLEYGYRYTGDEFGGRADYVIEGTIPWDVLLRYNLPAVPAVGSEMGLVWVAPDPDNSEGFGGQMQCGGWADNPADYTALIFTDTPAGAREVTAVERDSWGQIKSTSE